MKFFNVQCKMVHWIYVLECEDDRVYIGETTRLYTRFGEHVTGEGGVNTRVFRPHTLIALYRMNSTYSFMKYRAMIKRGEYNKFMLGHWEEDGDNLAVENHITERYMHEWNKNGLPWHHVRGGKYTRHTRTAVTVYPIAPIDINRIVDRPLCKCGYPSEVKLSEKGNIYFVCCRSNVWDRFTCDLEIPDKCNFWEMYEEDKEIKKQFAIVEERSKEPWIRNIPESRYKINPESCLTCGKTEYMAVWNSGCRRLCQTCLLTNYETIKEKYVTTTMIPKDTDDNWD